MYQCTTLQTEWVFLAEVETTTTTSFSDHYMSVAQHYFSYEWLPDICLKLRLSICEIFRLFRSIDFFKILVRKVSFIGER